MHVLEPQQYMCINTYPVAVQLYLNSPQCTVGREENSQGMEHKF